MGKMGNQPTSFKEMTQRWMQRISSRGGKLALAAVSTGLVLVSLLGWALTWGGAGRRLSFAPGSPKGDLKITPPASLSELGRQFPGWGDILSDPELELIYREALGAYQREGEEAAKELAARLRPLAGIGLPGDPRNFRDDRFPGFGRSAGVDARPPA